MYYCAWFWSIYLYRAITCHKIILLGGWGGGGGCTLARDTLNIILDWFYPLLRQVIHSAEEDDIAGRRGEI